MIRHWDDGPGARRDRVGGAAATLGVHLLLALALLRGLGAPLPQAAERALEVFAVEPPPPTSVSIPPPPASRPADERRRSAPEREGAAAPPNLRSEPTPVVAPPPLIPMPVQPPIVAAPIAGQGGDPSAGAALVRGPGTGAGGFGQGRGSGYGGDGGGGGGGRGYGRRIGPRLLRGGIRDTDYPRWAWERGIGGTVGVRFTVAVDGRVTNCRITRSSGHRELDGWTCDLLARRYRFAPSRDEAGEPVPADVVESHGWEVRDEPDEDY